MRSYFTIVPTTAEVPNLRFQTGFGFFVLVPACRFKNAVI